jgi:glycosyltransferase involved in cell wall biosynthesis
MELVYSIVIPAYNEADELPATLQAIRAAMAETRLRGECIVVDNNSTDGTSEVALAHGADRVIFESFNQIARARNAGAALSTAPYLVFIDADTRVEATLLIEAIRQLQSNSCVGGGSVLRMEGEVGFIGRFIVGLWEFISKFTRIAAGSFIFCRRDAFEAVGGYDEVLYASEEIRFSRQVKRWGKARNLQFSILDLAPVMTSPRKLEWYSGIRLLGWAFLMVLMPLAVRSRMLCGFWYNRPAKTP